MEVARWTNRLAISIHRQIVAAAVCQRNQRNYSVDEDRVTVAKREDSFLVESDAVKDKKLFEAMIDKFKVANPNRRGHVEFITVALKNVEEFQVHKELSVYKALIDLFPKEKMRPKNRIQAEFVHFPRHQDTAIELLRVMGVHGVIPDQEFRQLVLDVFGPETHVFKKLGRMLYWLPKFKNVSPYRLPDVLPNDTKDLALLGVKRITGVDPATEIEVFDCNELANSKDKTWIVSGQSWKQRELLLEEKGEAALKIEGPFTLWMKPRALQYFTLIGQRRIKPKVSINADDVSNLRLKFFGQKIEPTQDVANLPCVHEQLEGTIFACCATGTSSRDSLLSWLRFLQEKNPILEKLPIVFKLKAPSQALVKADIPNRSSEFEADTVEGASPQ